VIVIIIIICIIYGDRKQEGFTDLDKEAIQNVASLYNTGDMKVTNLTASTSITTPKLDVNGPATASSLTDRSMNNATVKGYVDTTAANLQYQLTTAQGSFTTHITNLQKQITALQTQAAAKIYRSPKWDITTFLNIIQNDGFFKDKPNGYVQRFIFVHPNNDTSTTNYDYWHGIGIKMGQQFLMWRHEDPKTNNIPNPDVNRLNGVVVYDTAGWRGNAV